MRTIGFTALALCALLVACSDTKKSFDDSFNKGFHENFISSCTSSAMRSGVPQDVASKLCTCASDKMKERFSVREKMSLKPEQVNPIVAECRASVMG